MQILLGADPEIFVKKQGNAISAHGMIPGTKKDPFKVENGAVQIDGTALEFNIDPAENEGQFVHNIQTVMEKLKGMLPPGHEFDIVPARYYEKPYFDTLPIEATELGCDPDYNAYYRTINIRPDAATTLRTAAGHVHIGWTKGVDPFHKGHFQMCCQLTKQLDYYLMLGSLFLDPDQERRKLYGKRGAFRPKPYGCEYRVLSNFWLKSPALIKWVFNQTHLAVKDLMEGYTPFKKNSVTEEYISYVLNSSTLSEAENYLRYAKQGKDFPKLWEKIGSFEKLL